MRYEMRFHYEMRLRYEILRIDRRVTYFNRLPGMICKMSDHQEKFCQVLTPSVAS